MRRSLLVVCVLTFCATACSSLTGPSPYMGIYPGNMEVRQGEGGVVSVTWSDDDIVVSIKCASGCEHLSDVRVYHSLHPVEYWNAAFKLKPDAVVGTKVVFEATDLNEIAPPSRLTVTVIQGR